MQTHGETVSAFYTSNVEQYLFDDGIFDRFARTVAGLPRNRRSVFIRSYFRGGHPQAVSGYHATQLAQLIDAFVAVGVEGGFPNYFALVTRDVIPR